MAFEFLLWTMALVVLILFWVILTYNGLVRRRLHIGESWSNVDTELKRRHDLIPNLVTIVRAFAAHERDLLTEVTRLRMEAGADKTDSPDRMEAEQRLAHRTRQLLAVAESYPQVRAAQNFQRLQEDLVDTEDRIQAARRFYNGNVRDYNNAVQQFPSSLVARAFGFVSHEFFELDSVADRTAPSVNL